jgi:hypothetical protein
MTQVAGDARQALSWVAGRSRRLLPIVRRRPWISAFVGLTLVVVAGFGVVGITGGHHNPPETTTGATALLPPSGSGTRPAGSASGGGREAGPAGATSSAANGSAGFAQSSAAGGSATAASAPLQVVGNLPNEVPALATKVVKTGTLELQVAAGAVPKSVSQLTTAVNGLGGYVASSSESVGASSTGNLTLRVPVTSFDALVAQAKRLGTTLSLTTSGQDVTAQYVDLQARITGLQSARTQFEQILARAQSIGDILSVESQISDVQTQLEQLQGQLNVLSDQAAYSTLTVQLSEVGKPAPVPPKPKPASGVSKAWSHALHSFAHGAESILAASGGIALFVVTLGIILLIIRLAWILIRRRPFAPQPVIGTPSPATTSAPGS